MGSAADEGVRPTMIAREVWIDGGVGLRFWGLWAATRRYLRFIMLNPLFGYKIPRGWNGREREGGFFEVRKGL
jgi:hypothetical protein